MYVLYVAISEQQSVNREGNRFAMNFHGAVRAKNQVP